MHAHDVLNGASLIILSAPSFEEIVGAHEPPENLLVAVPGALEQAIFTKVIFLGEGCEFLVGEERFEDVEVLGFDSKEEGRLAVVVAFKALGVVLLMESFNNIKFTLFNSDVHRIASSLTISCKEVQKAEIFNQVINHLCMLMLNRQVKSSFTVFITMFK